MRRGTLYPLAIWIAAVLVATGCGMAMQEERHEELQAEVEARERGRALAVLEANLTQIEAYADSIESAMRPVPLLTGSQRAAFTRFGQASQLAAARRLGIAQPVTEEAVSEHLQEGGLVRLGDNEYWTLREMEYSTPVATPDLEAALVEISERFQDRIAEHGLPPLRLEITSLLRSADDQEALREVNPNAARGESTHQYGTTADITYASFRAPLEPVLDLDTGEAPWLETHLRRMERMAAETGAARMSRELQAILGEVLLEMQREGTIMVILEQRQPVYHLTVARSLTS